MTSKFDPENYRKLLKPFEDTETANKAMQEFYDGVGKLRNELGITDVHVLIQVHIMNDGEEGAAMSSAHFGDTLQGAMMCAWGLGQEQANFEDMLRKFVANK